MTSSSSGRPQKEHHHHHHRTIGKGQHDPTGLGLGYDPTDTSSLAAFESFQHKAKSVLSHKAAKDAVTLVTQTDLSRIARLREICKRWKGPLVASVFLPKAHPQVLDEKLKSSFAKLCEDLTIVSYTYPDDTLERWYPINKLRNLGIQLVNTSHYLVVDIDFLPDEDLRATLQRLQPTLTAHPVRTAVVVPAFEYLRKTCDDEALCNKVSQRNVFALA